MKFTADHIDSINRSVLCWLATASKEKIPNVSPKEIFTHFGGEKIIIANIASPQTVRNIHENIRCKSTSRTRKLKVRPSLWVTARR
ncbi:MAG: pyridoxamine 5'-phosphate oxidase family protein [Bacteroidota bacterium]